MDTKTADLIHLETLKDDLPKQQLVVPYDAKRHALLRRKIDRRMMPLCAWLYLLNYLDRSNIGNAKILNSETGDSFLQSTGMTARDYSITITLFAIAYSVFDVPSNWIMKRYVRPSVWLASLLFSWGLLTLGFAFVKNYSAVLGLRFVIGVFEAGFFPGEQ
jgi:MFS family permease